MTSTLPPLVQAFSGALGGAAANASAYPLDLVCTRLQTSHSRERQGIYATLRKIIKKRGFAGLYDGLQTDTAATLISSFFYFYAYSFLRNRIFKRDRLSSNKSTKRSESAAIVALEEIVIGFLAGIASRAVSTPLSLVTVRLQSEQQQQLDSESSGGDFEKGKDGDGRQSRSIASVVKRIYAEGGLRGFWRGFETTTFLCLNPSLTLFLYQAYRKAFLRGKDREQPSPRHAFVGAAISNVIDRVSSFARPYFLADYHEKQPNAPLPAPPRQNAVTGFIKVHLKCKFKRNRFTHLKIDVDVDVLHLALCISAGRSSGTIPRSRSTALQGLRKPRVGYDGQAKVHSFTRSLPFHLPSVRTVVTNRILLVGDDDETIELIIIALYLYYIQHKKSPRMGLH